MGITVTNSMLKSYLDCKRAFHYKFIRNLAPNTSPLPLKRGSWLHELLEAHYVTGDWQARHKELSKEFNKLFDEEKDFYGDLPVVLGRIMESYCYHYNEEDSHITVVAAEETVEAPMPHGHTMKFRFDLISEDDYGRWMWEHKSHKTIPTDNYRFMDVQTSKYVWGLNELGTYGEISGVIWNYLRTKEPTYPPQLKKGGISMAKRYDTDLFTFIRALKAYDLDPRDYRDKIKVLRETNNFFRRDRVPKPKKVVDRLVKESVITADEIEKGVKPVRSIGRQCDWCSFKDLCVVELYGGNAKMIQASRYHEREQGEYYADEFTETES